MLYFFHRLIITGLTVGLLAACGAGPRAISGEPPLVSIESLLRQDNTVQVDLAVRNINDQSLEIRAIAFRLRIDDKPLASGARGSPVSIAPRSREIVRLHADAQAAGITMLEQLTGGTRSGLRWQMDLTLTDDRGRDRETESSGWLHAVPGQPGRFR